MTDYLIQGIEDDVMNILNNPTTRDSKGKLVIRKVYIDSGALNDEVVSYEYKLYKTPRLSERKVTLLTTHSVFPAEVDLHDYDHVDTEEFNGNLFIHVS